jgi:glycerate kinase
MKIVVAPDSFKGSVSAAELCSAISRGILNVYRDCDVIQLPLADGGEGTTENMVYATGGTIHTTTVSDPLGRKVEAGYGVLGDKETVVIEIAKASGLHLLSDAEKNPLAASTYGTGELIKEALNAGYRKFIIGLGGSATNDGGSGMLRALGAKFLDSQGNPLPGGGEPLSRLESIDDTGIDPRILQSTFIVACDVSSPLCGPDGASAVFGPQKGASPQMVQSLDHALYRYAEVIRRQKGIDVINVPGAGAAGGSTVALTVFMNARIQSGIELVMQAVQFEKHIENANLVITGEGKLDEQTLSGKVIYGVCQTARKFGVPVIAICGKTELSGAQMDEVGLLGAFSIVPGPCALQTAIDNAAVWAENRTEQMMRMLTLNLS